MNRDELELRLKSAIKREREQLLLFLNGPVEKAWEDGFYRFYHQSHKVFRLQKVTREIVSKLQALSPERQLNSWFQQIIDARAVQTFGPQTNENWVVETRPIVEAFSHAKYFLEMACKEHDELNLDIPVDEENSVRRIRMVDSAWAALLVLFNIS